MTPLQQFMDPPLPVGDRVGLVTRCHHARRVASVIPIHSVVYRQRLRR